METFAIKHLTFSYPRQETPVLRDLSLTVGTGEFLVLCGPTGCGKSTLLRHLKPALTPHGDRTGEILFDGLPLMQLDPAQQSRRIGFVQQSPENQLVTDKVWHELAFGLENLGCDTQTIRRRTAEMASFFGIQSWFHRDVSTLSGGQKQLLNLAAVMTLQPDVLVLDEPTSRLDPIAAADFFAMLGRINRELGTTVILTEHRLEEVFPLADRVAVMDSGQILCVDTPAKVGPALRDMGHAMFLAMPAAMQVWAAAEKEATPAPITVREGRDWLADFAGRNPLHPLPPEPDFDADRAYVLQARDLWFRYEKNSPDVIKGLSLRVRKGELFALLGGNGTGKTTALRLLSGLSRPYRGTIRCTGTVGLLPQDPQTLFTEKTVRADLRSVFRDESPDVSRKVQEAARLCRLEHLLDRHPYDLSGGEQQRAALAKVLLCRPDILLLDEPTKGLDAHFRQLFGQILQDLLERGVTVVMVSHDVEFCARYAHRCALLFDGAITAEDTPRRFFSGNSFYTTAANRMGRALLPQAVTTEDLIHACGGTPPAPSELPPQFREDPPQPSPDSPSFPASKPLSPSRALGAWFWGLFAAALFLYLVPVPPLDLLPAPPRSLKPALYTALPLALLFFTACVSRPAQRHPVPRQKLPGRTTASIVLLLLAIPITLFVGVFALDNRRYALISLLVLLEAMLPFFLLFEGRRPQARALVLPAVLCALAVAGRMAFFMLPQFKPVMPIAILAGAALGGETGFLVGAVSMLVSNMMFSQGPWTPWQMFGMGIVGFLAGLLFHRGLLPRSRAALSVFGAVSAIAIYGVLLNSYSALLWMQEFDWKILLTYWASGFPMDCIHAAGTWFFLWVAARPMLEKLERIETKYGPSA